MKKDFLTFKVESKREVGIKRIENHSQRHYTYKILLFKKVHKCLTYSLPQIQIQALPDAIHIHRLYITQKIFNLNVPNEAKGLKIGVSK